MTVYFDNAATTPLDSEVFEAMKPYLLTHFGNPSSIHAHGRAAKAAIESSRKKIAELLHCNPGEIIFTSGGTEADNTILFRALERFPTKHIITSRIEHHAVLHTLEYIAHQMDKELHFVDLDSYGMIEYGHLEKLLAQYPNSLVSLMHANNEIGNLLDIQRVGEYCAHYQAYFHSDTVQAMGHYKHDLSQIQVDSLVASAHKFHGPKGAGFMFIRNTKKLDSLIHGGGQERNMRGGTENVAGIVGLSKALEIAYAQMDADKKHIEHIKTHMINMLKKNIPQVAFNGHCENPDLSLYTVLNVSLPESDRNDMLLFNLDLAGISVSGGSACSSGALMGSHVLHTLFPDSKKGALRFSFSKFNTLEEVDYAIRELKKALTL